MKKLFKRLRLKLGLFTRKELYDFSCKMKTKKSGWTKIVSHADIENYIEDLNNN